MIVCNLPVLLAERRMKVADVARETGMSKTTLHKLYNGQSTRIDFETIEKLMCRLFDHLTDMNDELELEQHGRTTPGPPTTSPKSTGKRCRR